MCAVYRVPCAVYNAGQLCWTACSKNSAAHKTVFVDDAARLFGPLMSDDLVTCLNEKHSHLCTFSHSFTHSTPSRRKPHLPPLHPPVLPTRDASFYINHIEGTSGAHRDKRLHGAYAPPCTPTNRRAHPLHVV